MLGDPGDAEEAAQDALVRAYRALAGYEPADPRASAAALAGHDRAQPVPDAARPAAARRPPPLSLDIDGLDAAGAGRGRCIDSPGRRRRTARRTRTTGPASWRLPPAYRAAVVLRHVDGLSYPDLALALDRPEGTVKAQVHRGLAMLRTASRRPTVLDARR